MEPEIDEHLPKLPPLRPVMTEREKVLDNKMNRILYYCNTCLDGIGPYPDARDVQFIQRLAEEALNFKYGGGE